jgi:adenine-specific DNA-methyltransferase
VKVMDEVTSEKLRGAFYTSPSLVKACLRRITTLLNTKRPLRILEPSSGDGAFIHGLQSYVATGEIVQPDITCIELMESEAVACREALRTHHLDGQVVHGSFFAWADKNVCVFDAVVGNPPFVRYQFVPENDRLLAEWLLRVRGKELQGVSNLWIPFVLLSLDLLREGGAFALVLPSELLSTISGGQVRSELIRHFHSLQVDLFPRNAFPDILQDVLILSGIRTHQAEPRRRVTFSEHTLSGIREWQHEVMDSGESWTRYLLTTEERDAFSAASALPGFHPLKEVATIGVAIVTGANDFFAVDEATIEKFELQRWARPLLARTADSLGIIFTENDHCDARQQGKKSWLLDFSEARPDPMQFEKSAEYLKLGALQGLPERYKCRIRFPWYRVPQIQHGSLMMAKRAHQHHRLIHNQPGVVTTDTIYRGEMKPRFQGQEGELVSGFHNSVTLLSAEIEGRSYGGGVLELVPSELSRLTVPIAGVEEHLTELDSLSRYNGGQRDSQDNLVEATDAILCQSVPGYADLLNVLTSARQKLRRRRFSG